MRPDLFQSRKCIHVKLLKEVHTEFRKYLFDKGLSMQETFDEFARLVITGDKHAEKIVQQMITRKLKEEIDKVASKLPDKKTKKPTLTDTDKIGAVDNDALYTLIGDNEKDRLGT